MNLNGLSPAVKAKVDQDFAELGRSVDGMLLAARLARLVEPTDEVAASMTLMASLLKACPDRERACIVLAAVLMRLSRVEDEIRGH